MTLPRICEHFQRAQQRGQSEVACNLHRCLGAYAAPDHRMPLCCELMYAEQQAGDEIVASPPKGRGATLTVRYKLPRCRASAASSGATPAEPVRTCDSCIYICFSRQSANGAVDPPPLLHVDVGIDVPLSCENYPKPRAAAAWIAGV